MTNFKWLNLQLFAGEGAGATGGEGGEGATTGDNVATVDAGQRLRELGVPEDKIRKRASKVASKMPTQTAQAAATEQNSEATNVVTAPTDNANPSEETKTPARMSWDEIMMRMFSDAVMMGWGSSIPNETYYL